jgi:hypothetical protein
MQGSAGKDCDCSQTGAASAMYASVYSLTAQSLTANGTPTDFLKFDQQNAVSTGDFDLSVMATTGEIKFLKHGIYKISVEAQAKLASPVPTPVPSWSFGMWMNNALVKGSVFCGFTQSPNDDVTHVNSEVILEVQANDMLKIKNASAYNVDLTPNPTASLFPITVATVDIIGIKALA